MKKFRFAAAVCLCCLLIRLCPASASAASAVYFSYSLSCASASAEDLVRLDVKAYKTEETAAGFRLNVQYDEDKLDYISTETAGAVKSGTMRTNGSAGEISCVYVCNTDQGYAPKLSGTIASFVFQISADAKAGGTVLTVDADQICGYDGGPLDADGTGKKLSLTILPPLSAQASLNELIPSAGTLEPGFSPSVHSYTLAVGSGVGAVEFQAAAAEGGAVQVSRKTLNGAGKETQIAVTVTAANGKEKGQYLIAVRRAEKEPGTVSAAAEKSKSPGTAENAEASGTGSPGPQIRAGAQGQAVPEQQSPSEAARKDAAAAARQPAEERTLVLVGDRTPSFFTGMLAAALCITVGIAVSLWLPIRRRP